VLWPLLQIFELDLLEWFQWFEKDPKLVRVTLESRKIKSKREKSNREKIPFFTHIHFGPLFKSLTKATMACAIACETLIYQKQTLLHQRNTNQIKEKFKFNIHVIMVKLSLYKILPTLSPFIRRFSNQTLPTLCTSSKTSSR
jgi:hypothetical protein